MPRVTVQISDDADDWLNAEKERTGKSKAKLGGECIELIHSEVAHIEEARSDVIQPESDSRLDELEERVAELEARIEGSPMAHERDARAEAGQAADGRASDGPSDVENQNPSERAVSGSERVAIDEVLSEWVPEGEVNAERARKEATRAVEWLREQGGRHKRTEITNALADESGLSDRVWWERAAQPGLRELDDAGLVEYRKGTTTIGGPVSRCTPRSASRSRRTGRSRRGT